MVKDQLMIYQSTMHLNKSLNKADGSIMNGNVYNKKTSIKNIVPRSSKCNLAVFCVGFTLFKNIMNFKKSFNLMTINKCGVTIK